jgi:hypothetical protein
VDRRVFNSACHANQWLRLRQLRLFTPLMSARCAALRAPNVAAQNVRTATAHAEIIPLSKRRLKAYAGSVMMARCVLQYRHSPHRCCSSE